MKVTKESVFSLWSTNSGRAWRVIWIIYRRSRSLRNRSFAFVSYVLLPQIIILVAGVLNSYFKDICTKSFVCTEIQWYIYGNILLGLWIGIWKVTSKCCGEANLFVYRRSLVQFWSVIVQKVPKRKDHTNQYRKTFNKEINIIRTG